MSYVKTEWVANETIVSADNLNKIEDELEISSRTLSQFPPLEKIETTEGSQAKVDALDEQIKTKLKTMNQNNNEYVQQIYTRISEAETNASKASNNVMADGTSVEDAITSLKLSVSEGKSKVAAAITDKGVSTAATDSFQAMADNIDLISRGQGNATESQVLSGSTFSNHDGVLRTGSMPNKGAYNIVPSLTKSITIPKGYHSGNGSVSPYQVSVGTTTTHVKTTYKLGGSVSFQKANTIKFLVGGSYFFSMDVECSYRDDSAALEIRKGSEVVFTEKITTTSKQTIYCGVTVAANDTLEFWGKTGSSSAFFQFNEIRVQSDLPVFARDATSY